MRRDQPTLLLSEEKLVWEKLKADKNEKEKTHELGGTTLELLPDRTFTLTTKKVTFNPNIISHYKIFCYGAKVKYEGVYSVENVGTTVKVSFEIQKKILDSHEQDSSSGQPVRKVSTEENLKANFTGWMDVVDMINLELVIPDESSVLKKEDIDEKHLKLPLT